MGKGWTYGKRWFILWERIFNTAGLICGCSSCPVHLDQYGCQCYGLKLLLDAHYEAELDRIGDVSKVCVGVRAHACVCLLYLWVHLSVVPANKHQGHEVLWGAVV